jgi:hypothetical protein
LVDPTQISSQGVRDRLDAEVIVYAEAHASSVT